MNHFVRNTNKRDFTEAANPYQPRRRYAPREERFERQVTPAIEDVHPSRRPHVRLMAEIMGTLQQTEDILIRVPTTRAVYHRMKPSVTIGERATLEQLEQLKQQTEARLAEMQKFDVVR